MPDIRRPQTPRSLAALKMLSRMRFWDAQLFSPTEEWGRRCRGAADEGVEIRRMDEEFERSAPSSGLRPPSPPLFGGGEEFGSGCSRAPHVLPRRSAARPGMPTLG